MSRTLRPSLMAIALIASCVKPRPLPMMKAELERDIGSLKSDDWGMQCAPGPFGAAEAQVEFFKLEMSQGDQRRAEHHYLLARRELDVALSRADACRPKDRDKDGVEDHVDLCPDQAELINSYKDEDGCPEVDADGDSVYDDVDQCPSEKEDLDGWEDSDGCPDRDNDGDKILDASDACPDQAEDFNGYMDQDGCPEGSADRDRDGVADFLDKCPDEPENINEYLDTDGCPDVKPADVRVTADRIEIDKRVNFATGKALLLKDSYGILDSVAQVLRDYPKLKVRIEGHTDSQGSASVNKKLSDARAKAVFDYLVKNGGIAGSRMSTKGLGSEVPLDTNNTTAGRANNRRVEFHITDGNP
jgi:outer membrane protein OmpA-like peptidoglycan-associated protein